MVLGHLSSICLTDRIFLQTRVTFCEYLVFHEFRRNLLNILNKKVSQINAFEVLDTQTSQVLTQSHDTKAVGYCMIFQICFSLHLV